MGCALSSQEKEAVQRSMEIDKKLASEHGSKSKEVKLLLLGEWVWAYLILRSERF